MRAEGPWQQLRCCRKGSGRLFAYTLTLPAAGLTGHSRDPQHPIGKTKESTKGGRTRKFAPKEKKQRKAEGKGTVYGGPGPPCSPNSLSSPSSSSGGTLSVPMHPTLVVRKKSKTASVARPSNSSLTRVLPLARPPISYIFLACGAHARHWGKRWRRDRGSPLAHQQHSLMSIFLMRRKWDSVAACPDRSW